MKEHLAILQRIRNEELEAVTEDSLNVDVFEELLRDKHIVAIDACADDGREYLEPKLTLKGREFLAQLELVRIGCDKWYTPFIKGSRLAYIALAGIAVSVLWLSEFLANVTGILANLSSIAG